MFQKFMQLFGFAEQVREIVCTIQDVELADSVQQTGKHDLLGIVDVVLALGRQGAALW
ncbi:MAG TPA: hypothetical protein VLB10_02770 [Gammaproteobacteria bacterium]|jgi:hypothetical protein|nr:hypothetical protein [Gammaproteobacteria bacterium]